MLIQVFICTTMNVQVCSLYSLMYEAFRDCCDFDPECCGTVLPCMSRDSDHWACANFGCPHWVCLAHYDHLKEDWDYDILERAFYDLEHASDPAHTYSGMGALCEVCGNFVCAQCFGSTGLWGGPHWSCVTCGDPTHECLHCPDCLGQCPWCSD